MGYFKKNSQIENWLFSSLSSSYSCRWVKQFKKWRLPSEYYYDRKIDMQRQKNWYAKVWGWQGVKSHARLFLPFCLVLIICYINAIWSSNVFTDNVDCLQILIINNYMVKWFWSPKKKDQGILTLYQQYVWNFCIFRKMTAISYLHDVW